MPSIKDKAQGMTSHVTAQDVKGLSEKTGNIYQSICVMAKRARLLSTDLKRELNAKLEEFAVTADSIEEVTENKEQIEISKFYERLPNPALIATNDFVDDELLYRHQNRELDEADLELE